MNPKPTLPEPERWCDRPARGTAAEKAIGAAFRRVRQATEPADAALARLARRMDRPSRSTAAQLIWRVVLATILVIAMGGVVGAALKKWRHAATTSGQAPAIGSTIASSKNRHARRGQRVAVATDDDPSVASAPPVAAAPITAPPVTMPPVTALLVTAPPVTAPPANAAPVTAARVTTPPVTAPPANAPSVLAVPRAPFVASPTTVNAHRSSGATELPADTNETRTEAGLLAHAFRELRSGGDAASVLGWLDQYDRRFPNGALRTEARIARAEALMTSDRRTEALPLLEGIEESGGAVTRDVRISRGELFADTGRCANAILDFNAILAATDGDTAGGRALYGRAACHLVAGDIAAARRDLKRYLLLHPDGSSATAARHALDSLP